MAGAGVMKKNEFHDHLNNIPLIEPVERFTWNYRRSKLRHHMENEDVDNFFAWSTVVESLHSGWSDRASAMYDELTLRMKAAADFPHFKGNGGGPTGTSVYQAWYLQKWEEFTGKHVEELDWIHEFGGGYGAMAHLCRRLGFLKTYTVHDLPEVGLIRDYYLSNIGVVPVTSANHQRFVLAPDLYIAMFSLSEVPPEDRDVPEAETYLIGYQPDWGEIGRGKWDNRKWFSSFVSEEFEWLDVKDNHYPNHRMLLGKRRDVQ